MILISCFLALSCATLPAVAPVEATTAVEDHRVATAARLLDPALATGFDFPVGNRDGSGGYLSQANRKRYASWKIAAAPNVLLQSGAPTLSGESWNGPGGGATDLGQPVYAIADGTVLAVRAIDQGQAIEIEHRYLENARIHFMSSITAGLSDVQVAPGDKVTRRQKLGNIAAGKDGAPTELRLAIRANNGSAITSPSKFIHQHRRLSNPFSADEIVIAIKHEYRLHFCRKGKIVKTFPIALGQNPLGPKTTDGDNCTPEGEYRITQKALGPFDGEYGEYLGAAWMRISYPNAFDARAALTAGRITDQQCTAIVAADTAARMPPTNTTLGGGIGIHGWSGDWPDGPNNLTWGCLSLRKADLLELYKLVQKGTPVIIHR